MPDQLRGVGCDPSEVDTVMLTHLHADHVGWLAPEGRPYFTNADILLGAADWDALVEPAGETEPGIAGLKIVRDAGRITRLDTTSHNIAPGVSVEHSPGHTPGSYVVIVSSPTERAYLLGDIVQHPLQLNDNDLSFAADADAALATKTRRALLDQLEPREPPPAWPTSRPAPSNASPAQTPASGSPPPDQRLARWEGLNEFRLDGQLVRVATGESALAVREALLNRAEGDWLVVITDREPDDLGDGILAHLIARHLSANGYVRRRIGIASVHRSLIGDRGRGSRTISTGVHP